MTTRRSRAFGVLAAILAAALLLILSSGALAGTTVAIVKGKDPEKMMAEAVELLGGIKQFVKDGQKVVIKPNLVHQPALPGREQRVGDGKVRPGFTTDVRITKALARQMLDAAKCKVAIAEGTPNSATRMFDFLGYTPMAKELGIELVDTDRAERVAVKLDGAAHKEYQLPAVTQAADVLVDVAVMKTHQLTGVTLGMKNLFGLLPEPKRVFHDKIEEVLCDLCRARKPDLAIVDGLVAMEGQGPIEGTPVAMDLLVAGRDIVAVDAVCTAIMGFDPAAVRHLKIACDKGIGEADLGKIAIKGVPIAEVKRPFRHACWEAEVRVPKTDARVGRLVQLADHASRYKREDVDQLFISFSPGRLSVDKAKFPHREAHGFRAEVPVGGDQIVFLVPFRVLFPEEGQAAVEELGRWIEDHLGKDTPTTKTPFRRAD